MMQRLALLLAVAGIPAGSAERPCKGWTMIYADTTVDAKSSILKHTSKSGPAFPQELHKFSPGKVTATFVVDTTGRVMPASAEILSESHVEFGKAVCEFLTRATFQPALVNGRKMSVRISSAPFQFYLQR